MVIPVFILAGQSNASGLSDEIEAALDERYGIDNYELVSIYSAGAPITREREDLPDWSDPSELRQELTTATINALNEDSDRVIGGMIWIQGEADTFNEGAAARYGEVLEDLIDDFRDDVSDAMDDRETGLDVAPVTILELSDNAPAATDREGWDSVISEQRDVSDADPLVRTLDPDTVAEDADVSGSAMFQDDLHYAADFQYQLAEELVETLAPPSSFEISEEGEPLVDPVEDPDTSIDDPADPVVDPVEPIENPEPPIDDSAEPVDDPIIPVVDPIELDIYDDAEPVDEFDDDSGVGDLAWLVGFLPFLGLLG